MMSLGRLMLRPPWGSANRTWVLAIAHLSTFRSQHDVKIECHRNLYEVLGVSPTCSEASIRDAFRKLAKVTHPDMLMGDKTCADSTKFIVILSAYQILSNPTKRGQYDAYLRDSLKTHVKSHTHGNEIRNSFGQGIETQDRDVVDWLRWYRGAVTTIVDNQNEIGSGHGWQEKLKGDLQEALRRAYFGPCLDDMYNLPDCFEAEERAELTDSGVLHLVSGRMMIGLVRQVSGPELLKEGTRKLSPHDTHAPGHHNTGLPFRDATNVRAWSKVVTLKSLKTFMDTKKRDTDSFDERAYVGLELYLFGNLVARANRVRYISNDGCSLQNKLLDKITVHVRDPDSMSQICKGVEADQDVLVGTIVGLSTIDFGGKSNVYSPKGDHTHVIWQFKTPWVKHMHWFKISGKDMTCECRSTRARLPSSKFWLFKPRCNTHDIGGWYIETLRRNSSSSCRISTDWAGKHLGLLHPAMYIIGAAYKTLDNEAIKRQEMSWWCVMASKVFEWCKKVPS